MTTVSLEEQFLFDVRGCLLLEQVLTAQECTGYLNAISRLKERDYPDAWMQGLELPADTPAWAEPMPTFDRRKAAQIRFNGMIRLDPIFDSLIAHQRVVPYLQAFMGRPQLINTWCIEKYRGSATDTWHRGVQPTDYTVRDSAIRSRMLNVVFFLTDNGPEDGCMVAVPGSHKNNIDLDWGRYVNLEMPGSQAVTGKAGDVFLFSEAVVHNGLPKTTGGARTNLYYNYAAYDFNVMIYEPHNNYHFCLPPTIRERFSEEQKAMTRWMEYARHETGAP